MYLEELTERIIGAAIEVHRRLGPGLLESIYLAALCVELTHCGLTWKRQFGYPVAYRDETIGEFRPDLIVADQVIVEIKAVDRYDPVFAAQVLTYLRITGLHVGLLINFNRTVVKDGVKRFVL